MTTLAQFIKSEAKDVQKKFDHLTNEQAKEIVRFLMNRYVGRANIHDLIMNTPVESVYGYCPKCGAPGVQRERRPNGNDKCEKGCSYPSRDALDTPPPD